MEIKNNFVFSDNENINLFTKIANQLWIDKGASQHNYTRWYNYYFDNKTEEQLNILEIGVAKGRSIYLWNSCFKNSKIYGIEINKRATDKELIKGCKVFIGNQTDEKFLKKVCKSVPDGFDIVIDDGSHVTSDQIKTFGYLFKRLNPGGIYVIEDLQTSYQKKYQKGKYKSAVDYLKGLVDDINYNGKFKCNSFDRVIKKSRKLKKYEKTIEGMSFHAGICFIFKRYSG